MVRGIGEDGEARTDELQMQAARATAKRMFATLSLVSSTMLMASVA